MCSGIAFGSEELGSIPGLGRSPEEGKGCPLQHSGLENSMDCIVNTAAMSWTRLSDFHSLTHSVKAMVFSVVMYGCESWTVKKAESRRIDAFELWCWIRLLKVPWTTRRSNQSILKEVSPECSLEGLMLKVKL